MISSMLLPVLLALLLASYCIAGIPFGLVFSKLAGVDVREKGSGNIGATNVTRTMGTGMGVLTMLCDIAKGWVCTFFGSAILAQLVFEGDPAPVAPTGAFGWTVACIYLACICGHVFSPYLHFRGGKGIAVGFGAALGFSWPIALGLLVVWALCAVPSRYVSAGSTCAAVCLPFLAFFIYYPASFAFVAPFVLVAVIVVWAHRENLGRLRAGTERPFSFKREDEAAPEAQSYHEEQGEVIADRAGAPDETPVDDGRTDAAPRTVENARSEEQVELADMEAESRRAAAEDKAREDAVDVTDVEDALQEAAEAEKPAVVFGDEPSVSKLVRRDDDN